MSYDLEIGVKVAGLNKIVKIAEPELANPAYNLGTMFRKATGWDYKQSKWYCVADVLENIQHGLNEVQAYPGRYRQYEPANKFGTVEDAVFVLDSLLKCIYETSEYRELPYEHMWVRW